MSCSLLDSLALYEPRFTKQTLTQIKCIGYFYSHQSMNLNGVAFPVPRSETSVRPSSAILP